MFKKTLVLGIVLGIAFSGFAQESKEEKISLELVKEIRFEEKLVDDVGMINIGVITSQDEEKRVRSQARLSSSEPIFPIRAITIPGKGVKIFDVKGNVEREIKDGSFVSENGEYIVAGGQIKTRENKKTLKTKGFRGGIQAISNRGNFVTTERRDKYAIGRLNFYDEDGNLKNTVDINPRVFSFRSPRNMFQLSQNGEIFATWDDGELLAFSKEGKELFRYRILEENEVDRFDKIRISPCGRYIAVSLPRGGKKIIYPKDYSEKMKRVEEELGKMLDAGKLGEGNQSWTMDKYTEGKRKLIKEIVQPKEINDGPIRNTIYLFSREGKFLWSYDVVCGELAIGFSPEGDYVGVGDYHNVYLFEAGTGRLVWRYSIKDGTILTIDISFNGKYVVVAARPLILRDEKDKEYFKGRHYIYLFDNLGYLATKVDIRKLADLESSFRKIAITSDKKQILVMTMEKIFLFNLKGGDVK